MSNNRYIVELCPPINPADHPRYYEKIKDLLRLTKHFSITSHSHAQISGFDRSYSLAAYLLKRVPDIDILFHLSCHDLNKDNTVAKLNQLKALQIKRILVVSGQNYSRPEDGSSLLYSDSTELVQRILECEPIWFETVAIAGYPGGNGTDTHDNKEELSRLHRKLTLARGVNAIYYQCSFEQHAASELSSLLHVGLFDDRNRTLQTVPGVALFKDRAGLDKCLRLTRVRMADASADDLYAKLTGISVGPLDGATNHLAPALAEYLCKPLIDGQTLKNASGAKRSLYICAFGAFDMAADIIRWLESSCQNDSQRAHSNMNSEQ